MIHSIKFSRLNEIRQHIEFYTMWKLDMKTIVTIVSFSWKNYFDYNHYLFFANSHIANVSEISINDVRFDDFTIEKILKFNMKTIMLNSTWSTEFDKNEMIKVTRYSMNFAVKLLIKTNEMNVNEIVHVDKNKFYYEWWRGLQLLCETKNATNYFFVRSFHEKLLTKNMTWKIDFSTLIQIGSDMKRVVFKKNVMNKKMMNENVTTENVMTKI